MVALAAVVKAWETVLAVTALSIPRPGLQVRRCLILLRIPTAPMWLRIALSTRRAE